MSAILFGSISTLVDTSELQRRSFNESFEAYGLDWQWSRSDYMAMLDSNGGAQRIANFAEARGEDVDADAVHATKSQIFQELLATAGLKPRPGVIATVHEAKRHDVKLGFVTTTSPGNVSALLESLGPDIKPRPSTSSSTVTPSRVQSRMPRHTCLLWTSSAKPPTRR
jgi:beta-phosphoglucomutase-like phosphatase (HAD superfamily)